MAQHVMDCRRSSAALYNTPQHQTRRSFQITRIYEGTNQIQRMVIAKKLLG